MGVSLVKKVDKDLEEIMPMFLENRRADLEKLDSALAGNDFKAIEVIAHKLAGNAGSYGFPDLGDIGSLMEKMAGNQNRDEVIKLINDYKDYMSRLVVEFE